MFSGQVNGLSLSLKDLDSTHFVQICMLTMPARRRVWRVNEWPCAAAMCAGVAPRRSLADKLIPLLASAFTSSCQHIIIANMWAKKTGLFSDLITLWRLVLERCAVCQNFRNFIEKKVQNWHFSEFKYSLLNLLKSSQQVKLWYIWPEHMDFTQFTLTYSETTVIFPQS